MKIESGYFDGDVACVAIKNLSSSSGGFFLGSNPLHSPSQILLVQLSLSALFTAILESILTPLGETAFVSQMLAALALGPSVMGQIRWFRDEIFPVRSFYVAHTFSYFGVMLFMFLVGVKTDVSVIKKSGRKAVVIGFCNFFIPVALTEALALLLVHAVHMESPLRNSLTLIASLQSLTSFYVIACFLSDLKLLNSELGRLAISASMISELCNWTWMLILSLTKQGYLSGKSIFPLLMALFVAFVLFIVVYICRPIMLWMVRRTGEAKSVKESYIFGVFTMVLTCSLFGEILGQHFLFGPMILGLVVPEGPPLGSALVQKLDSYVSSILLPIYFVVTNAKIDFTSIQIRTFGIVQILALCSFAWKVLGTMLPSLYYDMSINDALCLALTMSVQGITELLIIGRAARKRFIGEQEYSIMTLSILLMTAIVSPIVKHLYKPSKKYTSYRLRTIQHTKPGAELRLLACIYREEHTRSIINLLDVSNPTLKSPISLCLLHLIELSGRSAPVLVTHHPGEKTSTHLLHKSEHIINAFRFFEEDNEEALTVDAFTSICPHETMHDEICALALDQKVSMLILPFHKLWYIDGTEESTGNALRVVNRNILRVAPCSVGILVDHGPLSNNAKTIANTIGLYRIAVIFLGGQDDREALAYATKMSMHPKASLSIFRVVQFSSKPKYEISPDVERDLDQIRALRISHAKNDRFRYKEQVVNDSVELVGMIREMENSFDLIMVGRRHSSGSKLLLGLTEWSEFPELGFIGDMLASSDPDSGISVLVVQQQAFERYGQMVDGSRFLTGDSWTAVGMPRGTTKSVCSRSSLK